MLKRFSFTILIPLLLVGASAFILIKMQPAPLKVTNRHIPTVFIHGYAGNDRSFHGMIRRFSEKYHWGTESLHIRVDTSGKLHTQGSYPTDAKNPLINIVFDDNRASIAQQSAWTKKAMRYLKNITRSKNFMQSVIQWVAGHGSLISQRKVTIPFIQWQIKSSF